MARNASSGSPFPAPRKDSGKCACWRGLAAVVAPYARGDIHRSRDGREP